MTTSTTAPAAATESAARTLGVGLVLGLFIACRMSTAR